LQFTEEERERNKTRVLNDETRNQTQEIRSIAIAEAEQGKSCSDTIKVETAIDEERKSLKLVNEAKLFH
jgi:hypothetical protein